MQEDMGGCLICNSSDAEKKYYPVRSGYLVKCTRCDFYYVNPRNINLINAVLSGQTSEELYDAKGLNARGRLMEALNFVKLINTFGFDKGHLLDIGCYDGLFLSEASKAGWSCQGVEPHKGAARYAYEHFKLDVKTCTLEQAYFKTESFDVITLLATLEHTPNPLETLNEVWRVLKYDGFVVISVPTIPVYIPYLKAKWRHFIGDHYFFFTDSSISKLLEKGGFKLTGKSWLGKSVDLDVITARLSDEWQPNNFGRAGELMRKVVTLTGLSKIRFPVNLFDTKVFVAKKI